jgi:hypothetical protein
MSTATAAFRMITHLIYMVRRFSIDGVEHLR